MNRLYWIGLTLALVLALSAGPATAQPGAPVLEYEWIKGQPALAGTAHDAVLRVTMTGDIDDPTSPGLVISGFNAVVELTAGVVDTANVVVATPSDLNAGTNGVIPTRSLTDYRLVPNAYPAFLYPTLTALERAERNVCDWEAGTFVATPAATNGGNPPGAGREFVKLAAIGVRDKTVGGVPVVSAANLLTDAAPTAPLGDPGDTTGTSQRAAFVDLIFPVLSSASGADVADFYETIVLTRNLDAGQAFVADDAYTNPSGPPPLPVVIAATVATFDNVDDPTSGDDNPQILELNAIPEWVLLED